MSNDLLNLKMSKDIYGDFCNIIDCAQQSAYASVNVILIQRNWLLGKRITDEELNGENRANYGDEIIKELSKRLNSHYGRGFSERSLYYYERFYKEFPEILHSLSAESFPLLSWSHYRILLQVKDPEAKKWYMNEAYKYNWGIRTLQRNISSQYYYRMLSVQVDNNEVDKTKNENEKLEFIKNPIIAEFLGLSQDPSFNETKLETSIITNLQRFIMELGKGYAFVARQQHIHTEKEDYYIDLVFYNYILKCFVLIDLKTKKITHQDVGQMDMYVRMYDELKKDKSDNPTLGIILCSDTDEDIVKYSVLNGNEQLFASKYKLYLPTKEELKAEIETQKALYDMQMNIE